MNRIDNKAAEQRPARENLGELYIRQQAYADAARQAAFLWMLKSLGRLLVRIGRSVGSASRRFQGAEPNRERPCNG
ncbi:hypothetical protein [Sediminicurvatus halobius]|uniref:Uncharacterized protein n=1 Tax=Sediminicurvatus halobius TaxID=2182432 RepID=A0A2U2MXS9_9GAMM|nr:hypothetical protein [Spiribacter halobius]PWG61835.1 hypothetical protein DEM34_14605 [Spiribacter halobius]UEX77678.1 hypothetical protein LMH63_17375 [Spiribacter halobius]